MGVSPLCAVHDQTGTISTVFFCLIFHDDQGCIEVEGEVEEVPLFQQFKDWEKLFRLLTNKNLAKCKPCMMTEFWSASRWEEDRFTLLALLCTRFLHRDDRKGLEPDEVGGCSKSSSNYGQGGPMKFVPGSPNFGNLCQSSSSVLP